MNLKQGIFTATIVSYISLVVISITMIALYTQLQFEFQQLQNKNTFLETSCKSSSKITTTTAPTTIEPTTTAPTTTAPTTMDPTTTAPTTTAPPTTVPTTTAPTTMEPTTAAPPTKLTSCKTMGDNVDGVYTITVNNLPLQVYCQHGGWTVIQKRYDGSLDYNRTFDQYAHGFGSVEAEHWIGLNHVHELTSTGNWMLRFDLTAFNGETAWAEYDVFLIDPGPDFTMRFNQSSYRGTAGNSLGHWSDSNYAQKFTTFDKDQDSFSSGNCAEMYGGGGGWWHGACGYTLTTGMPYGGGRAIFWYLWKGDEVLKAATMKIVQN